MCFSATGSLVAAAVLVTAGVVTLRRPRRSATGMLAVIPLIFAVQQLAEGVVWLTVDHARDGLAHAVAVTVFLAVALVLWPTWMPVALLRLEPVRDQIRRRRLRWLIGVGALVSTVGLAVLVLRQPRAQVAGHSVDYRYGLSGGPWTHLGYMTAYVLATIGPLFVTSLRLARFLGLALLVALTVTAVIKVGRLTSVWCFFAAGLSVLLVLALRPAPAPGPRP